MTTDLYTRAKDVFLRVCDAPREDRAAILAAACDGDSALRTEVETLLVYDEDEAGFDAAGALTPGDRVAQYTIVRIIGTGAMGLVYEAQQERPSRTVALKIVRSGVSSASLRRRLEHEAAALARLQHPGIAAVYETGLDEEAGAPFFAMELVRGEPLTQDAARRGLSVEARVELLASICDALQHAHQRGVIHRDLKPSNILVDEGGRARVLDFGIARITAPDAAQAIRTLPGQVIGTLAYMSPEQAAGDPEAIDARADIYALGAIAHELLAGALPLDIVGKPIPEALRMIQEHPPPRLGAVDRGLRGDLEIIVATALEKEPDRRYQSAESMAGDLRRALRNEPIVARAPTTFYQIRKFTRRHRPLVAAAALVIVAMVGATAISVRQAGVAMAARDVAEDQKLRADRETAAALREAQRAMLAGAAAAINDADPISARRLLDGADESIRGWPWRYWNARLDQSVAVIGSGGERIAGAWLSSDGDEVMTIDATGAVRRGSPWRPDGDLPRIASLAAPVALAEATADGRRIIAVCGEDRRSLNIFDAADGRLIEHVADLEAPAGLLQVSGDGRVICVGTKSRSSAQPAEDIRVWRADGPGGAWRGRPAPDAEERHATSGLALSRDGRWLASGFTGAALADTTDMRLLFFEELTRGSLQYAISDDGLRLATGGEDKVIRLWDAPSGAVIQTLHGHAGDITALAIDRAGEMLASAGQDLTIRLWDVRSGELVAALPGHTARVDTLRFAAGGLLMSIARDGSVRLWDRAPEEGASVLRGHESYIYAACFTPDGSRIISGAWDWTIRLWDAAGGASLGVLPEEPTGAGADAGVVTALAVSPDGRWLVSGHKASEWGSSHAWLWDLQTGRRTLDLGGGQGGVCGIVFGPDGSRLWIAWDYHGIDGLDLGALGAGEAPAEVARTRLLHRGSPRSIAISPDGRELACGNINGLITIRDAATGEVLRRLEGHTAWVADLAYHPSGRQLASASADGTARLWDARTGESRVLKGHWDKVYALAFSPEGDLLATGSEDTTILLWDVAAGDQLTQLRGHGAYIYSLAFSPDGARLVSGSGDHTVRIWDTAPVHERWQARAGDRE